MLWMCFKWCRWTLLPQNVTKGPDRSVKEAKLGLIRRIVNEDVFAKGRQNILRIQTSVRMGKMRKGWTNL